MQKIYYPSVERIVACNRLVLEDFRMKRADAHKVLSYEKLHFCIRAVQNHSGDIYSKAAVCMELLVQTHPFASGNRRTAFLVVKEFVLKNGGVFMIADGQQNARILQGIRERFYKHEEIIWWLKTGEIREFERL